MIGAGGTAITASNAPDIQARVVMELAPGLTTEAADLILDEKGVAVLPDLLVGGGGVVVSYFEWVQSLQESSGASARYTSVWPRPLMKHLWRLRPFAETGMSTTGQLHTSEL